MQADNPGPGLYPGEKLLDAVGSQRLLGANTGKDRVIITRNAGTEPDEVMGKHPFELRTEQDRTVPVPLALYRQVVSVKVDTAVPEVHDLRTAEPGIKHQMDYAEVAHARFRVPVEQTVYLIHFRTGQRNHGCSIIFQKPNLPEDIRVTVALFNAVIQKNLYRPEVCIDCRVLPAGAAEGTDKPGHMGTRDSGTVKGPGVLPEAVEKVTKKPWHVVMVIYKCFRGTVGFTVRKEKFKSIIQKHKSTSIIKTRRKLHPAMV